MKYSTQELMELLDIPTQVARSRAIRAYFGDLGVEIQLEGAGPNTRWIIPDEVIFSLTGQEVVFVEPTCSECPKSPWAKGLCAYHYGVQRRRAMNPDIQIRGQYSKEFLECSIDLCSEQATSKGMCKVHYMREHRRIIKPPAPIPKSKQALTKRTGPIVPLVKEPKVITPTKYTVLPPMTVKPKPATPAKPDRVVRTHSISRDPLPLGVIPSRTIMTIPGDSCLVGRCNIPVSFDGYCRIHLPTDLLWSKVMNTIKLKAHGL